MNITEPTTETIEPTIEYQMRAFFAGTIPLPPGINASYKRVTYKNKDKELIHTLGSSDELNQFKSDAALLLTQGYHDWSSINAIRQSKRKVPLKMNISFYFKNIWRRDIDGGIKAVQDAVFQHLELNDILVVKLVVNKFESQDNPRCAVELFFDPSFR